MGNAFNNMIEDGGADTMQGGGGVNTLCYRHAASGSHSLGDRFSGFIHMLGSAHADMLTGDDTSNRLTCGAGHDTQRGSVGFDILIGGAGNNTLNGGSGADVFVFANGFGNDVVESFQKGQ